MSVWPWSSSLGSIFINFYLSIECATKDIFLIQRWVFPRNSNSYSENGTLSVWPWSSRLDSIFINFYLSIECATKGCNIQLFKLQWNATQVRFYNYVTMPFKFRIMVYSLVYAAQCFKSTFMLQVNFMNSKFL